MKKIVSGFKKYMGVIWYFDFLDKVVLIKMYIYYVMKNC